MWVSLVAQRSRMRRPIGVRFRRQTSIGYTLDPMMVIDGSGRSLLGWDGVLIDVSRRYGVGLATRFRCLWL